MTKTPLLPEEIQSRIDELDASIRIADIAIAQCPGFRDLQRNRYNMERRRKVLMIKLQESLLSFPEKKSGDK